MTSDDIQKQQDKSKAQSLARRFIRHENGILVIILVALIAVLGGVTKGATLTINNATNVWLQSSTRGIAAIGQLFVILTAGIDLSVGGLALVTAIFGAGMMTGMTGLPMGIVALMMIFGIGFGAANGALVSRVGMPALIVTLGMWQVLNGAGYMLTGGLTIRNLPPAMNFFGAGEIAGAPIPVIIFVGIAVTSYFVLNHTSFGRCVYAVGGNPTSAWLSGINVKNTLHAVYCISGFLSAMAGFVIMSRVMSAGLATVSGLELDTIAAVVIGGVSLMGGRGSVIGAVLGVLILGVINNGMNVFGVDPAYQDLVKGLIIIGAVAVDSVRRRHE